MQVSSLIMCFKITLLRTLKEYIRWRKKDYQMSCFRVIWGDHFFSHRMSLIIEIRFDFFFVKFKFVFCFFSTDANPRTWWSHSSPCRCMIGRSRGDGQWWWACMCICICSTTIRASMRVVQYIFSSKVWASCWLPFMVQRGN